MIKKLNLTLALMTMFFVNISTLKAQCDFTITAKGYACKGSPFAITVHDTYNSILSYQLVIYENSGPIDFGNTTGVFAPTLQDCGTLSYSITAGCNGSSKTKYFTVNVICIDATLTQIGNECYGTSSLNLQITGTTNFKIVWRDPYGAIVGNANVLPITNLLPIQYTYTITDVNSGCSITKTYTPNTNCCANAIFTKPDLPSNTVTWSGNLMVKEVVHVKKGESLAIQNANIYFEPCAGIIVERGGSVNITYSNLTSCSTKWRGIEVWGKANVSDRTSAHGYLSIEEESTIDNAQIGILVGKLDYSLTNSYDFNFSGGIIKVNHSLFQKNRRDIVFINYPYEYENGINNPTIQNSKFITLDHFGNCTDQEDNFDILNPNYDRNIIISGINHLTLSSNEFLVVTGSMTPHAITIRENASGSKRWLNNTSVSTNISLIENKFSNHDIGVAMEQTNESLVKGNKFLNSKHGMLYLTKNVAPGTVWVADNIFNGNVIAGLTISPEENPFTGFNSTTNYITDLKTCSNTFTDCIIGIAGSNAIVDHGNIDVIPNNNFNTLFVDIFWDENATSGLTYNSGFSPTGHRILNSSFIFNSMSLGRLTSQFNFIQRTAAKNCNYTNNIQYKKAKTALVQPNLVLYPNPVGEFVNVNFSESVENDANLVVTDIQGKVCFTEKISSGSQNHTVNTKTLNSGMYFIRLNLQNGKSLTSKFIKTNE